MSSTKDTKDTKDAQPPTQRILPGSVGKAVERMQSFIGAPVIGYYDAATRAVVDQHRTAHGLAPTGVFDQELVEKITAARKG